MCNEEKLWEEKLPILACTEKESDIIHIIGPRTSVTGLRQPGKGEARYIIGTRKFAVQSLGQSGQRQFNLPRPDWNKLRTPSERTLAEHSCGKDVPCSQAVNVVNNHSVCRYYHSFM